ncbi:hypothetical protein [Ciceribacter azotifigens]|uniref:hypothetical protein n=1 Tax=Ciceribacter azotifigens TaxID=2069303 RepID=UPI003A8636DC
MSTQVASTDSNIAANDPPATGAISFQLTATNASSVPGSVYFNIFPPALKNLPASVQTITALVSPATTNTSPPVNLTWNGGAGALSMLVLAAGADPAHAEKTPVALGDTVAVAWTNGAFTITPSPGGPEGVLTVTFAPGIPAGGSVGLVVGPAPILVPIPVSLSPVTLEPDLSPTVTVMFGTAFQLPAPDISDESHAQTVTFKTDATSTSPTATASITVGLDNQIVETS